MIVNKIESVIWGIISLTMIVIAVMHPRIIYWILVVVCVVHSIMCYRATTRKTVGKMCKDMVGSIIAILVLCYLGQWLNLIFPYHASYEYEKDIAVLKEDASQEYYHFPDEIPNGASDVQWVCFPSLLQGSGYHKLYFNADEAYLQEIYNTYAEYATIYTYDQYAWVNQNVGKSITFPGENDIEKTERKNVEVFLLYDSQDANHVHNGGFYINQTEGYICFFAQ